MIPRIKIATLFTAIILSFTYAASFSTILGSQAIAIPTTELDEYTDGYFWTVNPEMLNRKIQPHQTQYQKEWLAIQEVLRNRLVWMELPYCYAEPGTYGYEVTDYGETVMALTDAVFYTRHPELLGRKIRPSETALVEEWKAISRMFPPSLC